MFKRRFLPALLATVLAAGWGRAADPVTLDLQAQCKVQTSIVTVGSVARLSGGESALREQIAGLDLADMKMYEQSLTIARRVVEYRLRLAAIDPAAVRVIGADRTTVTQDRRAIAADEVVAAARTEVLRWLSVPRETVTVELAKPVVVQLPQVPVGEIVTITATPHVKPVGLGRIQMHVMISTVNENLLGLGVELDVKAINRPANGPGKAPAGMHNTLVQTQPVLPVNTVMQAQPVNTVMQAQAVQPVNTPTPGQIQSSGQVQTAAGWPTTPYESTTANQVVPAAATQPNTAISAAAATNPNAVLVHPRQRVNMLVHSGGLNVSAVGEAQQDGHLGQTILVQNVDSKKMVNARVTGPETVEIQLDH